MVQFVNGCACAIDDSKEHVFLTLLQRYPGFPASDDDALDECEEEVAELVMDRAVAEKMIEIIQSLLEDSNN